MLDPANSSAADLDGDHVLVGFVDDRFTTPIILGGIPHPQADVGHAATEPAGRRMRLTLADGDPDFIKHHGAFYGIDPSGSYQLDLRYANNGTLQPTAAEAAPTPGAGGHSEARLNQLSHASVSFYDTNGNLTQDARYDGTQYLATFAQPSTTPVLWAIVAGASGATQNVATFTGYGASATLALGNGAVHAAIAEHLQALWGNLVTFLQNHQHPTPTGPSGPATPLSGLAPAWTPNIQSGKMSLPDG